MRSFEPRTFSAASTRPEPTADDAYVGSVPAPEEFTTGEFRTALAGFPTGVTIVTTGSGAEREGMTVSSFNSVSLDPPLISFCAGNGSQTLVALEEHGSFAVSVLAQGQDQVCYRFADKKVADRFADNEFLDGARTGAPILKDALASFECEVYQIVPAGDHKLVLGRVVGVQRDCDTMPMAYWGGQLQPTEGWQARS